MPRPPQLLSRRDYSAELAALDTLFSTRKRGDLVTHAEIEAATKLKQNVSPWQTILQKFKKTLLRNKGIALRSERNVGYRLMNADGQLKDDYHGRRARRALQREFSEKVLIQDHELTTEQKALQGALMHQTCTGIRLLQTHAAERKSFLASPETVNRYVQANAIRPRAAMVNEADETEQREDDLRRPDETDEPDEPENR